MFEKVTAWDNLYLAWQKASRHKRGRQDVAAFEHDLEANLLDIQHQLLTLTWQPAGYVSFYIQDPKFRLISAAPFADRVIHHAVCNVIEPMFEPSFIEHSYANRIGKGNHRAITTAQQYARRFHYVLSLDVQQFFQSIDHHVLHKQLILKIDDPAVMNLIDQILASGSGVFADHKGKGLPIGNLTSQFWANVYLNPLDHFIKRTLRCKGYVRFVDDMRLFADNKQQLWHWKQQIMDYLGDRLALSVHPGAQPQPVLEGFGFLGFHIFPQQKRLKQRKGIQYQRKLKQLVSAYQYNRISAQQLLDSIQAWNNHVGYANTVGLRKRLFNQLPAEIIRLMQHLDTDQQIV
ncbi:MAG: RNA-directed DNA polymerase [Gammaproteobacteria bacterium]|nr:RNA-directed DNA polymerase [Gammaproteobacteria bacterium]